MNTPGSTWKALLGRTRHVFTSPSFTLFCELAGAWVVATGRRTICGMVAVMDPATRSAHDAYHRLVRAGAWSLEALWAAMVGVVIEHLSGDGPIVCYLDDTLFHRAGRKVEGAGSYRDAVRSTRSHVVYARGLNLVVLAVRIDAAWGGMPIAVPVGVRLHRKGEAKLPALAVDLMGELAARLPERSFILCADGAYACLAGAELPRTTVVSRMRRDAALFGPKPPPTGRRGRPRQRGERLPTPPEMAAALRRRDLRRVHLEWRGGTATRLVWSRQVLWYGVRPHAMVRLVIVRDPAGVEPDDFFFTTDVSMDPADVVSVYGGRWAIECTYRDTKQIIGGQEPQTWKGDGPERAAHLAFWLHGTVWLWYLAHSGTTPAFNAQPWYTAKRTPSFADAIAGLRRHLWHERITPGSQPAPLSPELTTVLVEALAMAA
ncbi:MAG: IS701 family transposase [Acidimicrobiales bacterium]